MLPREAAAAVQTILGTKLGLSNRIEGSDRLEDALREARLALAHANAEQPSVIYSEVADKFPWLPQNLDDATQTFRHVLGNVADHDEESQTSLIYTLKIFLEHNGSWQSAAEKLHIHKTRLVYRIRRIEAVTGRSLNNTADVAAMWLALQSAEILGLPQVREKRR